MKIGKRGQFFSILIIFILIGIVFCRYGYCQSNNESVPGKNHPGKKPTSINSEWTSNEQWIWQAHLNSPDFHYSSDNEISLSVEQLDNDSRIGYPSLPRFIKLFNALPEDITFHTSGKNLLIIPLPAEIERFTDISKPDLESVYQIKNYTAITTGIYPKEVVSVSFVGYVDNVPLTRLTVYPYRLIANGKQLRYYQDLSVSVSITKNNNLTAIQNSTKNPLFRSIGLDENILQVKRDRRFAKSATHDLFGKELMRIVIEKDGIYRISKSVLIGSGAVISRVDPRTFQMFNNGHEVPIFVNGESDGSFDKSDYIEFYGQRNRNSVGNYEFDPFTDKNVYFLTWGEKIGLRYAEESAKATVSSSEAIVPVDYYYTLHYEENNYFDKLGKVDTHLPSHTRDHWFFNGGINGGTTQSNIFQLIHPNQNTVKRFQIEVGMHGLTYQEGDHTVTVYINNYEAATGSWSGQVPYVIKNAESQVLQNRFLVNGDNKIQLAVAGDDPTSRYDKVHFDHLKVHYHRLYRAYNDRIDFTRPFAMPDGRYHFKIDNFNDPDISIYKIGKSKLRDFSVEYNTRTKNYSVLVEDNIYDDSTFYFVASTEGMMDPLSIQPDTVFNIANNDIGSDLLIITDHRWKHNLSKLVKFYRDINIEAQVVSIRDIYNEFNNGIISPYALKKYLAHIHESWTHKPEYILIIGDSKIKEEESVPAFFFQSYKYGACSSDHWYVVLDEETHIPEFSIGRWPVSTDEELEILIEKRISFSKNSPVDQWRNELLFIAGFEDAFKNQSEDIINRQVPKEFSINRIYINPSSEKTPFWGGSDTLIYLLNNGLTLVNFMGHGGGAVWSDRSLFNSSHIPYLENIERLPFMTSMTCFTGDFVNMTGLGEHLLLAENGGSIGLWGASGVGWIKNDYLLAKPFYDAIFEPGISIGKAIQSTKISYLTDQDYFDYLKLSLVYSYNLIGDPTINLPFPDRQSTLTINEDNPDAGQEITLRGTLPFESGDIYTQLYDSSTYRVFSEPIFQSFSNSIIEKTIQLPDDINPGNTFINYYFRNSNHSDDGHGVTLLSIQGLSFYGFQVQPSNPGKNDPITFSIKTELSDFSTMICEIDTSTTYYEYLDASGIEHIFSFPDGGHFIQLQMIRDSLDNELWNIQSPISIGTPGKLVGVRFIAEDNEQNQITSSVFSIKIKHMPDFSPVSIQQKGETFPELVVTVNYSGDDTLNINSSVFKIEDGNDILFGNKLFQMTPNHKSFVSLPGILGQGWEHFKVVLDPQNLIPERNESNNILTDSLFISTYPLLTNIGTSVDGVNQDTIAWDRFSLYLEPNCVADSSVINISSSTCGAIINQPAYSLLPTESDGQSIAINISIPTLTDTLLQPLWIGISPGDSVDETASIGRWDPYLKIWIKEETRYQNSLYSAKTSKPGKFTLIICQDFEPPKLELSLDGQQFFQNSYVSREPNISIVGEDQNGVLFDTKGINVKLDGNNINFSELNIPDTLINGNYVSAQFRPKFDYGDHVIEVRLSDAAGNITSDEILFTVSDELKLIDYGNYPNPFKDRTTFIYELTRRVEKFKIKIYTPSGRLIKVLEESTIFSTGSDINEGGYHEIMWNGLDDDGNFIANGVYFYKMSAKSRDKTVSSIGKIAKAR